MPRTAREHSQFGYIHVICRGINKQVLFEEDRDYSFYLYLLEKYSRETGVTVNAYCLMDNHVHLLLCDLDRCVATMMKKIGVAYAGYFNRKYERTGHLFQGRFHSVPIENEIALKTVFRYILQNPKKAGICNVDEYRWSSYDQYGDDSSFVDTSALVHMIGDKAVYRELVGAEVEDEPRALEMKKRDDEWAKAVLMRCLHVSNGMVLQTYDKTSRDKALHELKKIGLTIRQIERLTGINRGVVQRA